MEYEIFVYKYLVNISVGICIPCTQSTKITNHLLQFVAYSKDVVMNKYAQSCVALASVFLDDSYLRMPFIACIYKYKSAIEYSTRYQYKTACIYKYISVI